MSSKNKSQLRTENSSNFPNNNSQFITPEKLRDFNNDVIDSMVVNQDTGSYLLTSSFDTGSRDLTFTRVDGTIYSNNIPGGGGSSDTGSLLITASVVDATTTYTKGNGDIFTTTIDNVANSVSSSYAVSSSQAENATSASHAEQADNATSSSNSISSSVVTDPNIAYINKDNTFSGTQNFNNISVSGTGSFGRIEAVTGSAKIIGDAFVVVNADTPTLRYAGLQVYDSGSSSTASIEWDGLNDSWILVEEGGQSSFLLTGPTGSKGSEVNLSNNSIAKAGAHRQLLDSNITDDGSTITLGSDISITGNITGNNTFTGINKFTSGPQVVSGSNGYVTQTFTAPAHPSEKPQTILVGASNGGTAYNRVFQGVLDYSGYGLPQTEDAFSIEYFDSLSYGYGSQYYQNGKYLELGVLPQSGGASNQSLIRLKDDGDGSSTLSMQATDIDIVTIGTTAWSGSLDITGNLTVTGTIGGIDSGSFALKNAANTFTAGPQLVSGSTGYVTQQFTAPAANNEYPQTTLVGASNGGTAYNRVFQGVLDYSNFGLPETEDAFAIEYFDGFGYNYGSQFYLNGKSTELGCKAQGGGASNQALIKLQDVGNNTTNMSLKATTLSLGTDTSVTSTGLGNNSNTTIIQGNNVNFNGNTHTFNNTTVISGSVQNAVDTITIASNTASLDFNGPSLQTIELVSGSDTRLEVQNRKEGVTINLKVRQPGTGYGNLILDNPFKEPRNSPYSASQESSATDILTFVSFEASDTSVYVANVKTLD